MLEIIFEFLTPLLGNELISSCKKKLSENSPIKLLRPNLINRSCLRKEGIVYNEINQETSSK